MRKAWQQIGEVIALNRKIQFTQLGMWVSQMMFEKHLKANQPERVFQITSLLHAKIKGSPYTIRYLTRNSLLPAAVLSGSFRKMTRPNGLPAKRLLPGGNTGGQVAELIRQLNEGKITAAPPLVLPDETPTLDKAGEDLGKTAAPAAPSLWSKYAFWILLLILFLLLRTALAADSFLVVLLCLALGLYAIWRYLQFRKTAPVGESQLDKVAENLQPENMTPEAVDEIPYRENFSLTPAGMEPPQLSKPLPAGSPASAESPEAREFRAALVDFFGSLQLAPPPEPPLRPLDFGNAYSKVMGAIQPVYAFPKRVIPQLVVGGFSYSDYIGRYADKWKFTPLPKIEMERIVEVMAYPHFKNAMYEPLRDASSELFVPNLNLIPPNTISLMVTNQPFIESYMVGLNHEFSRELLWREYPTDQRGSYFRQFWNVDSYIDKDNLPAVELEEKLKDIPEIHRWGKKSRLGAHNHREQGGDKEQLVLVIRGDLLKRYPNTIVYAMRAKWDADPDHPNDLVIWDETGESLSLKDPNILYPLYKAEIKPDITFLGFDLTIEEARGHADLKETAAARATIPANKLGWFFVIKEVPGEPRFGLDEELADNSSEFKWDNMSWKNLGADVALIDPGAALSPSPSGSNPQGINWNSNSADLAYILYQKPVLVAVHSKDMLKNLD